MSFQGNAFQSNAFQDAVGAAPSGIAFDAASNSGYQTAQATYTWNHTCTGSNRWLCVGISMLSVAGSSVTSITYDGVVMGRVRARTSVTGAVRSELWGLVNPNSGTHVISVTLSVALDSIGGAVSLVNVNQTQPTEADNDNSATNVGAADATVDVTTLTDNDWVIDVVATTDTAITVGAGQTSRNNVTGTLGSGAMSTEGPKTPVGAVTMNWTNVDALQTWTTVATGVRVYTATTSPLFGWYTPVALPFKPPSFSFVEINKPALWQPRDLTPPIGWYQPVGKPTKPPSLGAIELSKAAWDPQEIVQPRFEEWYAPLNKPLQPPRLSAVEISKTAWNPQEITAAVVTVTFVPSQTVIPSQPARPLQVQHWSPQVSFQPPFVPYSQTVTPKELLRPLQVQHWSPQVSFQVPFIPSVLTVMPSQLARALQVQHWSPQDRTAFQPPFMPSTDVVIPRQPARFTDTGAAWNPQEIAAVVAPNFGWYAQLTRSLIARSLSALDLSIVTWAPQPFVVTPVTPVLPSGHQANFFFRFDSELLARIDSVVGPYMLLPGRLMTTFVYDVRTYTALSGWWCVIVQSNPLDANLLAHSKLQFALDRQAQFAPGSCVIVNNVGAETLRNLQIIAQEGGVYATRDLH